VTDPRPPLAPEAQRAVFVALASLAGVCLAAGAAMAIYLAWVVYLLVESPRDVPILAHLMELATTKLLAFNGNVDGRTFEVNLGEPVYWIALLVMAAILLGVVFGAARALIRVGADLLTIAIKGSDSIIRGK
jgi:hypothetical protein